MPPYRNRRQRADRYRPWDNIPSGRTSRTTKPDSNRREAKVSEEQMGEERVDEDWVGSSLLSAMDKMDLHVDEMLNAGAQPLPPQGTASMKSSTDTAAIRDLIHQEITHIMDRKVSAIVDAAVTERIGSLAATNLTSNSASLDARDRRVLRDLDMLHHHEADLNKKLVERLFQANTLTREHPEQRFARTTSNLKGTDSVASVLVSHVEALVAKVEGLQKRVRELGQALTKKDDGLPY